MNFLQGNRYVSWKYVIFSLFLLLTVVLALTEQKSAQFLLIIVMGALLLFYLIIGMYVFREEKSKPINYIFIAIIVILLAWASQFNESMNPFTTTQVKKHLLAYKKAQYEIEQTTIDTNEKLMAYIEKIHNNVKPFLTEKSWSLFQRNRDSFIATQAANSSYQIKVKDITIDRIKQDDPKKNLFWVDYQITVELVPYDGNERKEGTHHGQIDIIVEGDQLKIGRDWEEYKNSVLLEVL
ncbi:hypothetical protein [Brevibacillus daliensis]|uniref:hypothetical protein n=1 Tax=Brevibacillus daliensis TaxID=2892995 RepID=UPI001E33196F|nr:hypothetical protein [Brevibacillus daliensis]